MKQGEKKPLQKKIEYISWLVLGVLLLLSSIWASRNFTMGIFFGGLISILNFYGLGKGLQGFFGNLKNDDARKSPVIYKYLLRLLLTAVALYIIIAKTTTDIIGLLVGLSTIVISIFICVFLISFGKSNLEEV